VEVFAAGTNHWVAAAQIQDSLYWTLEAHNEWALTHPKEGDIVPWEKMASEEGLAEILRTLKASARSARVK
jgi:hypothetical protein